MGDDERRSLLEHISLSVGGDWALSRVAWLAYHGLELKLTLIIDGCLLAGDTAKPEVFADHADAVLGQMLDHVESEATAHPPSDASELADFEGLTSGDFAKIREQFARGVLFRPVIDERRAHDSQMRDQLQAHQLAGTWPEEASAELQLWQQLGDMHVPTLTLRRAVWTPPTAGPLNLPDPVRVITSKVSTWWIGRAPRSGETPSSESDAEPKGPHKGGP
jgi:hypothetical protein